MEEKKYLVIDGKKAGIEDLTGRKFGRLTVIRFDEELYKESLNLYKLSNKDTHILKHNWLCNCECNKNKIISVSRTNLIKGKTISCGCYKTETTINRGRKNITKNFEEWCLENSRQDYLDLWDYELNNILPNEVGFGSEQYLYFKCPNHIHNSELKKIISLTRRENYLFTCIKCNSFAQWGINNICLDFLEKYWDYNKNIIDPWVISYASDEKVWIKCQIVDYHGSYKIACKNFKNGKRCSFCGNKKVHYDDSLGKYLQDNNISHLWSEKNKKSPFEIAIHSNNKYWFKCENGIHKDHKRTCNNSVNYNFNCPECSNSKGEKRVSEILMRYDIEYTPQQEYDGLIGLNCGNLRFDFAIPLFNINIEYDGIGHYEPIDFTGEGIEIAKEKFKILKHHDKLKNEYCKKHNIKLIRIPYWDFDNIEDILIKELKLN